MQIQDDKLDKYTFLNTKYKIIADTWLCGSAQNVSVGNGRKFEGAYPAGFLKNWKEAFANYIPEDKSLILHVCSGRVPNDEGKRLDIDPTFDPDYLCNAETFRYGSLMEGEQQVPPEKFIWAIADPPYNEDAAIKYYSRKLLKKNLMIKQMTRVVKIGGFVGILDQTMPQSPPRNLKCVARIGITSVPNLDMRIFTVFRKIFN